jgi:hypothetical protein
MIRQIASRWAPLGFAALSLLGCGTPPGQFVIVQNQVPSLGCIVPADLSTQYRGIGTLDVQLVGDGAAAGYLVFPLLENNLPPPTGQTADPNRITLANFQVEVRADAAAGPVKALLDGLLAAPGTSDSRLVNFSTLWSGSVASGGGHNSATVMAIPAELARRIRDTGALSGSEVFVMARLRARGSNLSGDVTSDAFDFPIRVCDGCLIASAPLCSAMTPATHPGNACNVAQDDPVDCCSPGGVGLKCPTTVSAK